MTNFQINHSSPRDDPCETEPYFIFAESSKLKHYIKNLMPKSKTFYQIKEINWILLNEIKKSHLYDSSNPYIILCNKDPNLKYALSKETTHINELRDIIAKEMFKIEDTEKVKLHIKNKRRNDEAESPFTEDSLTSLQNFFNLKSTPEETFEENQKFMCRPKFLKVLNTLPYFKHEKQDQFSWHEINNHLQTYMLINRVKFFHKDYKDIAIVKDSLLGDALQVNAFHKDQIKHLALQQLIPIYNN